MPSETTIIEFQDTEHLQTFPIENAIKSPPEAKWYFWPWGRNSGFTFHLVEAPCWFHRLTQRIILGWFYERIEKK